MNTVPASEKVIYLISYCLGREWVTSKEIAEYFECSDRQAKRLMDKVRDMQFEIGFYDCEIEDGSHGGDTRNRLPIDYRRIKIQLDRKYQT